jgi:hypothetical protein
MQEIDNNQFDYINKYKIGLKELEKSKYQKIMECKIKYIKIKKKY